MDIVLERILSLIPKKPNGDYVHGAKKDFAASLGMPHNTVTMWIKGDSKSYERKLHQIADTYNVSVEWLKGETDVKEKPTAINGELSEDLQELASLLDGMSDDKLEMIVNYVKFLASQE